jgi:thiol-disulfide isomerase/thioredoxin
MKKVILLLIIILNGLNISAQKLSIKLEPADKYPFLVLYKLKDVKQSYIDNKKPDKDGNFIFDMAKQKPGVYMLMYDANPNNLVYFLYNNEDVSLKIYPEENNRIDLLKSKENTYYLPYVINRNYYTSALNAIERKIAKETIDKKDFSRYYQLKKELDSVQNKFEKDSNNLLANKYIKAMREYYPDSIGNKKEYFADKKAHYFENINFNDKDLQHSNVIIKKINDYVINMNTPVMPKTSHLKFLQRIESILPKITDENYRNNVIMSLTTSFVNTDGRVSKILINKYIKKMPEKYQKMINVENILREIGLLIGEKAPDFTFKDLKKSYKLYDITKNKKYTLLVFWSSTCPHCLRAMPKIQEIMKNRKDFNIVAIGLESERSPWVDEHQYYPEFIHGIKLEKWDNPIVKLYQLQSTPTFFIVNKKNEIIAIPYEVSDLKKVLESLN